MPFVHVLSHASAWAPGMLMLAVSWLASIQLYRKGEPKRWLAYALVGMAFSGWVATVAGWYTTEIGRQPWLVQGVLSTADAASNVAAGMIATTLAAYVTVYVVLIAAFISTIFYLARKAGEKPDRLDRAPVANRPGVEKIATSEIIAKRRTVISIQSKHGIFQRVEENELSASILLV